MHKALKGFALIDNVLRPLLEAAEQTHIWLEDTPQ